MCAADNDDGFTLVTSKRRQRGFRRPPAALRKLEPAKDNGVPSTKGLYSQSSALTKEKDTAAIAQEQVDDIIDKRATLNSSKFLDSLSELIAAVKDFGPEEVVCYGIGSLANQVSQWQLALILILNTRFDAKMLAFDPATSPADIHTYQHFGVNVIETNEVHKDTVLYAAL
ncbi:hypothetical protein EC988_005642 [Linderina pennispora]|nr:hypothetical protein EC988_005642 [Linderina pennispora]